MTVQLANRVDRRAINFYGMQVVPVGTWNSEGAAGIVPARFNAGKDEFECGIKRKKVHWDKTVPTRMRYEQMHHPVALHLERHSPVQ